MPRLTETMLQRAKASTKRQRIWDTGQSGFLLQIEVASSKHPYGYRSFKFHYKNNGNDRWFSIGTSKFNKGVRNGLTVDEARKQAAEIATRVNKGEDPHVDKLHIRKKQDLDAVTFGDLYEKYLERHATKKLKSWKQLDANMKRYALPEFGDKEVAAIRRKDVIRIHERLTDKNGPGLANLVLAHVSAVFTWALNREEVDLEANPCRDIQRNGMTARSRVVPDSLFQSFWEALDQLEPHRGRALKMILLTAQRPGEVRHMRHSDIERVDGGAWWHLRGKPDSTWVGTKNGKDHRVWLAKPALAIVDELDDYRGGYVFKGPRRGKPFINLAETTQRICKDLGIISEDMDREPTGRRRSTLTICVGHARAYWRAPVPAASKWIAS